MQNTLLYLPEHFAGLPLWGWGWGLIVWTVCAVALFGRAWLRKAIAPAVRDWGATFAVAAIVLLVALPALEQMPAVVPSDDVPNHGVPIRGYGVMLAIAVASSVALAAWRAPSRGFHVDVIYQLAIWVIVSGIIGARLLFVVQHLHEYRTGSWANQLFQLVNIAGGGLVVYGSLIGAALAFLVFTWRHQLPRLALADVIAPSLVLGLALGRIGCFLNGCCWGGLCTLPWSVTFPKDSPVYLDHLARNWVSPTALRSLPVHPTQLYDSLNALIILAVLLAWEPLARRAGELLALLLILYPSTRFVLEWVRQDESGFGGTSLTLSQYISLGLGILGVLLFWNFSVPRHVQKEHTERA